MSGNNLRNTSPEALKLEGPDFEPFAFKGYPDNAVYIHGNCGTVIDVAPGPTPRDTWHDIEQGNCNCETPGPWFRIYVERAQ